SAPAEKRRGYFLPVIQTGKEGIGRQGCCRKDGDRKTQKENHPQHPYKEVGNVMKTFTIGTNDANQRFDKYLKKLLPNASVSF
ncbi:hypothetical protein EI533_35585, partial [Pseudomonas donghuensis]|nr:hypothetical protein [Pseudomonas donghuensis]